MASSTRARIARTAIAISAVALGMLASVPATAGSAYRADYDYPERGDDWYGRSGFPDPDRDYAPFAIDEYSAGVDFDRGHDPDASVLGLLAPIQLTRERTYEYFFRYDTFLGCAYDGLECGDGVWCNGSEFCGLLGCASGPAPCTDGDPCTDDDCTEGSQSCSNPPVTSVPPVATLALSRSSPSTTVATLDWSASAGADHYNVYRGEDRALSDLSCFQSGIAETTLDDDGAVATQNVFYYLTSVFDCALESSLGDDSGGTPRPNPAPCP